MVTGYWLPDCCCLAADDESAAVDGLRLRHSSTEQGAEDENVAGNNRLYIRLDHTVKLGMVCILLLC